MNLYNTIQKVLNTASSHILVNEVGEGDIYEYLNSGEHKYPCVFLTVTSVVDNEYTRNINGTLFYVDRLLANQSNKTSIQSVAVSVLRDMLQALNVDVDTIEYNTFTEKFTDLCAGAYVECQIPIDFTSLCEDNFEMKVKSITENGIYEIEGYDTVDVKVVPKIVLGNELKLAYSKYTEVPDNFDFSQTTDFRHMFYNCTNLTTISQLDTSNGANFGYMFTFCTNLVEALQLDTSNGTNFNSMFGNCKNLTTISQLDTSKGIDLGYMFEYCSKLTTIPQLNTSNGTSFYGMFRECTNLITIPQLDTSNGANFGYMFSGCKNLTSIPQLDISKSATFFYMFNNCTKLENITFTGSINANIDFVNCVLLTYESVKSILTACANTTKPTTSKSLTFNRTIADNNGELANLIAQCNAKNWTITGLTLT